MPKEALATIVRLRDIRQALAVAWWRLGEIYLRSHVPGAEVSSSYVSYGREGYIDIGVHAKPISGTTPSIYLPGEVKDVTHAIRKEFHFSFAGSGLIGQTIKIESKPDIAEIDWAERLLRPFWPPAYSRKTYHVQYRFGVVFDVNISGRPETDAEGKLETEDQLVERLRKEGCRVSVNNGHGIIFNTIKAQVLPGDIPVLGITVEDYSRLVE